MKTDIAVTHPAPTPNTRSRSSRLAILTSFTPKTSPNVLRFTWVVERLVTRNHFFCFPPIFPETNKDLAQEACSISVSGWIGVGNGIWSSRRRWWNRETWSFEKNGKGVSGAVVVVVVVVWEGVGRTFLEGFVAVCSKGPKTALTVDWINMFVNLEYSNQLTWIRHQRNTVEATGTCFQNQVTRESGHNSNILELHTQDKYLRLWYGYNRSRMFSEATSRSNVGRSAECSKKTLPTSLRPFSTPKCGDQSRTYENYVIRFKNSVKAHSRPEQRPTTHPPATESKYPIPSTPHSRTFDKLV